LRFYAGFNAGINAGMMAAPASPSGNPMSSSTARQVPIVLMVLLLFATQACTDIFLPGLPAIAAEFGVDMQTANFTISAYNYGQALVVLFIGVVSDLYGRRPTILLFLALHIAASIWIALTGSLSLMIALRVVQAAGSAAVYIVLRLVIKDTLDKKAQIHATGLLVIGLVLSPVLAPVVGAGIIHLSSWRYCFWAIALFEVPLFAWAWRAIGETNREQAVLRAAFSWTGHFGHYGRILCDRYFLGIALLVGAAFAAFYSFISISSYLYIGQYGVPAAHYASVFIALAIFYLAGNRWMSGLNTRNVAPQRIVRLGLLVSLAGAAAVCLAAFVPATLATLAAITLGTCLLRLATALIIPPVQVVVTNHFHAQGSHALGLLTCIQYAFAALGTMLVSSLPFQPDANFTVSTLLFVLLSLAGYVFAFRRS
jgi:DHA1 family bicyclomycin/chloramphenicol resistance-like MFS transporter